MSSLHHLSSANIRSLFSFLQSPDILVMMIVSESLQRFVIQHTKALRVDHQSLVQYFHQLCRCKNLKALVISDTRVNNASIATLVSHCSSLTSLNVSHCNKLTDAAIAALARQCPLLTSVNVCECRNLTDASIIAIARQCPLLTRLDVSNCWDVTDASITAIARQCPLLTWLDVSHCCALTDASITAIARQCPLLTSLNVGYCFWLTDAPRHCYSTAMFFVDGVKFQCLDRYDDRCINHYNRKPMYNFIEVVRC